MHESVTRSGLDSRRNWGDTLTYSNCSEGDVVRIVKDTRHTNTKEAKAFTDHVSIVLVNDKLWITNILHLPKILLASEDEQSCTNYMGSSKAASQQDMAVEGFCLRLSNTITPSQSALRDRSPFSCPFRPPASPSIAFPLDS